MKNLIPEQIVGKSVDLTYTKDFSAADEAIGCFRNARQWLLSPTTWHSLSGNFSAEFFLTASDGTSLTRLAQERDYIKIDVPGPGPMSGKGYDWVQVEVIVDEHDALGIKLCPCSAPINSDDNVAHFFTAVASSTLLVKRNGTSVTSYYYGRNEMPNVETRQTLDNVRNAIIASGAMASFSEVQWMSLIKGLLKSG